MVTLPSSAQSHAATPAMVALEGPRTEERFWEFFGVTIRNRNTRRAYMQAISVFFAEMSARGIQRLSEVRPLHVAAHIETLGQTHSAATVKLRLAAVRMLCDWLVAGQVLEVNPAASVRGPRLVVRRGTTPALVQEDMRQLLSSLRTDSLVGLRDRAFLGLLAYTFARVGAATTMRVEDVYPVGRRSWVRLREKGGKILDLPAHHNLEAWLHDYIDASGIAEDRSGWLFRAAIGRSGRLSERPLLARNALDLVRRRARDAGIAVPGLCVHSFRATGITTYLQAGGSLEMAQSIAGHANPRTTKLYDRSSDAVTLDEVERIMF